MKLCTIAAVALLLAARIANGGEGSWRHAVPAPEERTARFEYVTMAIQPAPEGYIALMCDTASQPTATLEVWARADDPALERLVRGSNVHLRALYPDATHRPHDVWMLVGEPPRASPQAAIGQAPVRAAGDRPTAP